jgi:hypothetical protein
LRDLRVLELAHFGHMDMGKGNPLTDPAIRATTGTADKVLF